MLADGRMHGVTGYYLSAVSFVEYLVANRGMGGVNDLLRAMGETGSVDEAFRRVHGQTYSASRQAWQQRLRGSTGAEPDRPRVPFPAMLVPQPDTRVPARPWPLLQ
jgi:hypothetical protein